MERTILIALGATILMWGSSFPVTRVALGELAPMELAFLRFAIASLAMLPVLLSRRPKLSGRDISLLVPAGILGVGVYALALNFGLSRIGAGPASFIIEFGTPLTILGSAFVLRERLRPVAWIGVGIGFAGVAFIASDGLRGFHLTDPSWNGAALIVLLAAASHAASFIMQKPVLERQAPSTVAAILILSGTVALGLVSGFSPSRLEQITFQGWACLLYLGLMPGALANFTWAYVLSRMAAGRATIALYAVPLVSQALAVGWLSEPVNTIEAFGSALIVLSLVMVNAKPSASSQPRQPMGGASEAA